MFCKMPDRSTGEQADVEVNNVIVINEYKSQFLATHGTIS